MGTLYCSLLRPEKLRLVTCNAGNTLLLARLGALDGYEDAKTGFRITVMALNATGHTAVLGLDGLSPACVPSPPQLTTTVPTTTVVSAQCSSPQLIQFQASVTNPASGCGRQLTTVSLSGPLPSDWSFQVCDDAMMR